MKKILKGDSDAEIDFGEICGLLNALGFTETIKGGHHLFRKQGIGQKINFQRDGNQANPYQIRQIRNLLMAMKEESKDA